MVVTTNEILGWCGVTAARRAVVIADIMPPPEGLANLSDETEDDLKDACKQYPKRSNQPFTLSWNAIKKIVALMHWVQDRTQLNEEPTFPAGYTRDEFLQQLREASERAKLRLDQKKIGESLIGADFTVQLKTRHQWERWLLELKTTLGAIVGAKGIPLTYVIREDDAPNLIGHATWEDKAIAGSVLDGHEYV